MLGQAQAKFLKSLIGKNGMYSLTITENSNWDLGTKILYLERAITEKCYAFLQSLDRLYDQELSKDSERECIEFIRALKTINDLCWNNDVRFELPEHAIFNPKTALSHWFDRIGGSVPDSIEQEVKEHIHNRIFELTALGNKEDIEQQKIKRKEYEGNLASGSRGWRLKIELLAEQTLDPYLTAAQYQSLSPSVRDVIDYNLDKTHQLMTQYPSDDLRIFNLIKHYHIPLKLLFSREKREKAFKFYNRRNWFIECINNYGFNKEDISQLMFAAHQKVYQQELTTNPNYSINIDNLSAYETNAETAFMFNFLLISHLSKISELPFSDFLPLDSIQLRVLRDYDRDFTSLVKKISFSLLIPLEPSKLTSILLNSKAVLELIGAGFDFNQIPEEESERLELFQHCDSVPCLLKIPTFSYDNLLKLESSLRTIILKNGSCIAELVGTKDISFERLCCLSTSELEVIIQKAEEQVSRSHSLQVGSNFLLFKQEKSRKEGYLHKREEDEDDNPKDENPNKKRRFEG